MKLTDRKELIGEKGDFSLDRAVPPPAHPTSAFLQRRRPERWPPLSTEEVASSAGSVRVLVLPPGARLGWLGLRRPLEQEAEVRRDERIGCRHRVGVVDGPVLAREGDPARSLAQPVLGLG